MEWLNKETDLYCFLRTSNFLTVTKSLSKYIFLLGNKSQDKRPDGTKIQNYCDYIHWTAR